MSLENAPEHGSNKLRAPAAAKYVGLSPSTLAKLRMRGDGPVYSKAGARIVVYDLSDLDAWINSRRRQSTSDTGCDPKPTTGLATASDF